MVEGLRRGFGKVMGLGAFKVPRQAEVWGRAAALAEAQGIIFTGRFNPAALEWKGQPRREPASIIQREIEWQGTGVGIFGLA
jgi:hypothetical protein